MKRLTETLSPNRQAYSNIALDGHTNPALKKSYNPANHFKQTYINLFSVAIRNCTMKTAVYTIIKHAENDEPANFAYVNADCLNKAWSQPVYREVLGRMTEVFGDGIGVKLASKMRSTPIVENVNGTDMFPLLCQQAAQKNLKLFLLGSQPGVAALCAEKITRRFPGLIITGTQDGYFHEDETQQIIDRINESGAHILIVAFGAPLQELWMDNHRNSLKVPVCIGVGGCLDFFSERIARAPKWVRQLSMEWVWRLFLEPKRMWRRYVIGNPLFLYRAWKWANQ